MSSIENTQPNDRLKMPYFFTLERIDQRRALESLIFASEEPLTPKMMHRVLVLEDPTQEVPGQQQLPLDGSEPESAPEPEPVFEVPKGYFDEIVEEINVELEETDRPFRVVRIAGGYQFATTPQHGQLVQRLLKARSRRRLTQAALETLAIVAYRQPITKGEVDAIRGVNASEVVNSLAEKGLVTMVGRSEQIGKPILYGTTEDFLRLFGLNSLSELPKLREIDDLIKTTTTMVEDDETINISTDHRTLRKQLALLLEDGGATGVEIDKAPEDSTEATSGAYWHHSMENEAESGLVADPEKGKWEEDAQQTEEHIDDVVEHLQHPESESPAPDAETSSQEEENDSPS